MTETKMKEAESAVPNNEVTKVDGQKLISTRNESEDNDCLTTGLLVVLFTKPLDRDFIMKIEDSVIDFINSNERTINLKAMNSYQRFLSYKVADYHNLRHTILRNDENSTIVLYKETLMSQSIKEPLLKNLRQEDYNEILVLETLKDVKITDSEESDTQVKEATTVLPRNKKFKILKRKEKEMADIPEKDSHRVVEDSNKEILNNDVQPLNQYNISNLEEQRLQKEREYEEKKQKIFCDNQIGSKIEDDIIDKSDKTRPDATEENEAIDSQDDDFEEHIWGPVAGSIKARSRDDIPKYYASNSKKERSHSKYVNHGHYSQRNIGSNPVRVPSQSMYPSFPIYAEYQTFPVGVPAQQYGQSMVYAQPQNAYGFQGQVPYMNYQMTQGMPQYNRYAMPMNGYGSPYMQPESVSNRNQLRKKNWNKKNVMQNGNSNQ